MDLGLSENTRKFKETKARIFLLDDLRDFFFRFRVGGGGGGGDEK